MNCPRCGSERVKVDDMMRGGSDRAGKLTYYRCECNALFSRLTIGKAVRFPCGECHLSTGEVCDICGARRPGPIAKPAHAAASAER